MAEKLNHQELEGLVAGYVLSALESAERKIFEEHLQTCSECVRRVAEMMTLVHSLPLLAEDKAPPTSLKERILAAASAQRTNPRSPTRPWWHLVGRPAIVAPAIGALILAIAGLAFWTLRLQNTLATTENRLARTYQAVAIMGQADAWWPIQGTQAAPAATGTLAYAKQQSASCLLLWKLPRIKGKSYQAWTMTKGTPTSVGVMWPMDSGVWIVIPGRLDEAETVLVTLEKAGGSAYPEGPVVVSIGLR